MTEGKEDAIKSLQAFMGAAKRTMDDVIEELAKKRVIHVVGHPNLDGNEQAPKWLRAVEDAMNTPEMLRHLIETLEVVSSGSQVVGSDESDANVL